MLYVFSNLSRNLNFIEHTRLHGWKLNQRAKPNIIDPGLYLSKKSDLSLTTQRRSLPTSFTLFTGSAWVILTRSFVEYLHLGMGQPSAYSPYVLYQFHLFSRRLFSYGDMQY